VSRVTSDDADAITYLEGLGIAPGAALSLESVSPFDGPVAMKIGGKVLHLGRRLAAAIHVAEDDSATANKGEGSRTTRRRNG
jgi:Fe2+ transport system protein FeoA